MAIRGYTLGWSLAGVAALVLVGGAVFKSGGLGASAPRPAHKLSVHVGGLRDDSGVVRVNLCSEGERFPDNCRQTKVVPARRGTVGLAFENVAEGDYAVAAFHDRDSDGKIKMEPVRRVPLEGVAFSNDAIAANGVPSFEQAKVSAGEGTDVRMRLRHLGG